MRLGVWILLETDDQVWNRFWKRWEIASEAFFVARPGVVAEVTLKGTAQLVANFIGTGYASCFGESSETD